jgi:hypothetical protein
MHGDMGPPIQCSTLRTAMTPSRAIVVAEGRAVTTGINLPSMTNVQCVVIARVPAPQL